MDDKRSFLADAPHTEGSSFAYAATDGTISEPEVIYRDHAAGAPAESEGSGFRQWASEALEDSVSGTVTGYPLAAISIAALVGYGLGYLFTLRSA